MSEEIKKEDIAEKNNEAPGENDHKASSKKGRKKHDKQQEELEETLEKLATLNDKYLRLYSEFDNYRKRTIKEKGELVKTASEEVITSLLPVLDDLERAISAMESGPEDAKSALEGIKLIYTKFKGTLQQKGLEAIESAGQPFDVDFHEAITNIPAPSEDLKGKVVDEIQKGYLLNGKVIRYSRVVVGA